jgi:diaminopimelate decarboxylase
VGGVRLAEIAAAYGTPAYVLDEADVRARCRAYRAALPEAEIAYAGKAFLSRAMIKWVEQEGLSLDVCSGGELALARHVGFPPERIVLHGNAKTPQDVHDALAYGVGRIVVDSSYEITQLAVAANPARPQKVLIRVTPGIDAHTHRAVATGSSGSRCPRAPPRTRSARFCTGTSRTIPRCASSACTAISAHRSVRRTCSPKPSRDSQP